MTLVHLRIHYDPAFYKGGLPQISFLLRGKNDIFDPRVSVSPQHRAYTENAALIWADYLSLPWDKGGYALNYATQIPLDDLEAAANVCDEPVPLAAPLISPPATEPAYACNGSFRLDKPRGEILQNILTSMGGPVAKMTWIGGQARVYPAAWIGNSFAIGTDPGAGVVALGDFSSLAAGGFEVRGFRGREVFNGVKGTYISQAAKWQACDFPPYAQDQDHGYSYSPSIPEMDMNLMEDGGVRRWHEIQLPFTISHATAQRIAKITLLWLRAWWRGTFRLKMAAYQMTPPDLLTMVVPYLGSAWGSGSPQTPRQLEIEEMRLVMIDGAEDSEAPACAIEIDVKDTDPGIYEWNTTEELSPEGYVQPRLPGSNGFSFFATEKVPGFNVPYPWRAGYMSPLIGDALFPGPKGGSPLANQGPSTFGIQIGYGITLEGNPVADVLIQGTPAANIPSWVSAPAVYAVQPDSTGQIAPGKYWITACAIEPDDYPGSGPASPPWHDTALAVPSAVVFAPSPSANTGSVTFKVQPATGIPNNGLRVYMSAANPNQPGGQYAGATGWHLQATLPASTDAQVVTLTEFDQSSPGAPDGQFDHVAVAWSKVIHAGVWAEQVQALTSNTIKIAGDGMTLNQWRGYTLSLLGKLDSTEELIILNMPVASSTASSGGFFTLTIGANSAGDQLPDLSTLIVVGDVVVMRFDPTFTAQGFSDLNIANPYYPTGASDIGIEPGHRALVLTGPDAGDVQTIASVTIDTNGNYTGFEMAQPWTVQPNDGDIVTILDSAWGPEFYTPTIVATADAVSGAVATVPVQNLGGQAWAFIVRSQNSSYQNGPDTFALVREIYAFGSQGTRTITQSTTMTLSDCIVDADASAISPAGPLVFTLLPFSEIPNRSIYLQKIDSSSNPVEWVCQAGDGVNGQASGELWNQWEYIVIVVSGNSYAGTD